MKPSRELDALVAEKVMGFPPYPLTGDTFVSWVVHRDEQGVETIYRNGDLYPRPYSTDIAAAWEVVEKMKERFAISISYCAKWECEINSNDGAFLVHGDSTDVFGHSDTAPHAICLAALAALPHEFEPNEPSK